MSTGTQNAFKAAQGAQGANQQQFSAIAVPVELFEAVVAVLQTLPYGQISKIMEALLKVKELQGRVGNRAQQ
jgi:hypothetical protein